MADQLIAVRIKDGLFVGNVVASQEEEFLFLNKVVHIINCASNQAPNLFDQAGVAYISFPWEEDGSTVLFDADDRVLDQIFQFIDKGLENGESVLVHSWNGVSRCCAAIAAYMMIKYGWALSNTLHYLQVTHPDVAIHSNYLRQLRAVARKHALGSDIFAPLNDLSHLPLDNEQYLLRNTFFNALPYNAERNDPLRKVVMQFEAGVKKKKKRRLKFVDDLVQVNGASTPLVLASAEHRNPNDSPACRAILCSRARVQLLNPLVSTLDDIPKGLRATPRPQPAPVRAPSPHSVPPATKQFQKKPLAEAVSNPKVAVPSLDLQFTAKATADNAPQLQSVLPGQRHREVQEQHQLDRHWRMQEGQLMLHQEQLLLRKEQRAQEEEQRRLNEQLQLQLQRQQQILQQERAKPVEQEGRQPSPMPRQQVLSTVQARGEEKRKPLTAQEQLRKRYENYHHSLQLQRSSAPRRQRAGVGDLLSPRETMASGSGVLHPAEKSQHTQVSSAHQQGAASAIEAAHSGRTSPAPIQRRTPQHLAMGSGVRKGSPMIRSESLSPRVPASGTESSTPVANGLPPRPSTAPRSYAMPTFSSRNHSQPVARSGSPSMRPSPQRTISPQRSSPHRFVSPNRSQDHDNRPGSARQQQQQQQPSITTPRDGTGSSNTTSNRHGTPVQQNERHQHQQHQQHQQQDTMTTIVRRPTPARVSESRLLQPTASFLRKTARWS
eukprot:NODE_324_length_2455_cov_26.194929_g300_i0.p1 GENE.NODE_324_length_2455_cov_26.194929_g300_i0~~NODE_324_length_2455_cov_26.194929_g300_i0.p1  ORF type:complete len:720 (+),score=161.75 NODE_324_length_2455_cov_26.194929_g300_i0:215-2374(+)